MYNGIWKKFTRHFTVCIFNYTMAFRNILYLLLFHPVGGCIGQPVHKDEHQCVNDMTDHCKAQVFRKALYYKCNELLELLAPPWSCPIPLELTTLQGGHEADQCLNNLKSLLVSPPSR